MFNSIIKSLNGHGSEAESLDAALAQLARDLAETSEKIAALQKQRHQALLDDASDTDLDKIERQVARAETRLEKLNMSEAPLRERLAGAQTAARKRRWDALHAEYVEAATKFVAMARATAQEHSALIMIVSQAQREGFSGLVASTMPQTPHVGGNPLLSEELLQIFEQAIAPATPTRRTAQKKPAKAYADLWDQNSPGYDHPTAKQLRTIVQPPAGRSLQHAVSTDTATTIAPLQPSGRIHAKKLPDDTEPLGAGEVRVIVIRSGYCGIDGGQSHIGRKVRVLESYAKIAAGNGAVEILNEAPTAANTNAAVGT
jgi:hypothetical protein